MNYRHRMPGLYRDNGLPFCWHYRTGRPGRMYWRNLTDAQFRRGHDALWVSPPRNEHGVVTGEEDHAK